MVKIYGREVIKENYDVKKKKIKKKIISYENKNFFFYIK